MEALTLKKKSYEGLHTAKKKDIFGGPGNEVALSNYQN